MNRVVLKSRVGHDGGLHLDLPAGSFAADDEVQVTIESVEPGLSEDAANERHLGLLSFAGCWKGPFERDDLDFAGTWKGDFVRPGDDLPPDRDPMI